MSHFWIELNLCSTLIVLWKSYFENFLQIKLFYNINFEHCIVSLDNQMQNWESALFSQSFHAFVIGQNALTSIKISVWSVSGWDWTYFREKRISTDVERSIRQNWCLLKYFNPKMISVEVLLWYYADACTLVNQPQKILKSQKQHLRK